MDGNVWRISGSFLHGIAPEFIRCGRCSERNRRPSWAWIGALKRQQWWRWCNGRHGEVYPFSNNPLIMSWVNMTTVQFWKWPRRQAWEGHFSIQSNDQNPRWSPQVLKSNDFFSPKCPKQFRCRNYSGNFAQFYQKVSTSNHLPKHTKKL